MLLFLIAGILVQFYSGLENSLALLYLFIAALTICSLPIWYDRFLAKFIRIISLLGTFYCLGFFLSFWHNDLNSANYFQNNEVHELSVIQITEPPQEKENSIKIVGDVIQNGKQSTTGKTLVYIEKDAHSKALKYGDVIEVSAQFYEAQQNNNPHEFNYKRYLKIHNIHHQAYVDGSSWNFVKAGGSPILASIYEVRNWCEEKLAHSGMSDQNVMVAQALLLGQKDRLDKNTLRSYSSAGAMHVLAVSGLHVGIIMLIVGALVRPIKRWRNGKLLYLIIVLLSLWFYAVITGLSPSVLRSAIMFSFVVVGLELQRTTSIYQSLMVSAFVLIVIDPWVIFQVGFQLSYLAVLGIVYLQPKIYNHWYVSNKVGDWVWKITSVSLAAQFATFPLGLYYFHQFPNFFLISNLIVIPLAFVLLISGISFLVFSFVPILADMLIWVFDFLLTVLNKGVQWIEGLPHSIYWGISISWFEVLWIYSILVAIVVWSRTKSKGVLGILSFSIVGLFASWIYQNKILSNQNKVFVYNIKDEVAIDVFHGSHNRFYCSNELQRDEEKLLFHVMHNWFYRGGKETPSEQFNTEQLHTISFGDNCLQLLDGSEKLEVESHTNYLLLHNLKGRQVELCSELKNYEGWILLGPNISSYTRNYIKSELENSQLVDISEGAYEITF